ncbi:expressed protein [Phakopsora pachyrhizi]|uniref:Expressed protein n=1 Tax=Phakopsora pachyrhizi TaxID=170000 RepID=A0AAV0AIQ9_PHAPC|nr:expressed protein [Phakopsora pachyrhizi]
MRPVEIFQDSNRLPLQPNNNSTELHFNLPSTSNQSNPPTATDTSTNRRLRKPIRPPLDCRPTKNCNSHPRSDSSLHGNRSLDGDVSTELNSPGKKPSLNPQPTSGTHQSNLIDLSDDEASDSDGGDEQNDYMALRRSPQKRTVELPLWTKRKEGHTIRLDSSSDGESTSGRNELNLLSSDESNSVRASTSKKKIDPKDPRLSGKNNRSKKPKSRSPTPPPRLSTHGDARPNASSSRRSRPLVSPRVGRSFVDEDQIDLDDDLMNESLDPAVKELARRAKAQNPYPHSGSARTGGRRATGKQLILNVTYITDPRRNSQTQISNPDRKLLVKTNTRQLSLQPNSLILVHKNVKLREGYESRVWEYVQQVSRVSDRPTQEIFSTDENYRQSQSLDQSPGEGSTRTTVRRKEDEEVGDLSRSEGLAREVSKEKEKLIAITVRDNKRRQLELLVRPTTTMLSIVKQFIKEITSNQSSGDGDESRIGSDELKRLSGSCKVEFDGEAIGLRSRVDETDIGSDDIVDIRFEE